MNSIGARWFCMALGGWLVIASFLWNHGAAQTTNLRVVGLLSVAVAAAALFAPLLRYANALVALWLFVSAYLLPTAAAATVWHNVAAAIAMFLSALAPSEPLRRSRSRELSSGA